MYNQLDLQVLGEVVAEALSSIHQSGNLEQRWVNAIAKAVVEIENNPFMHFDQKDKHLILWSQSSGETYTANGTCQCKAFAQGKPCYHRAAARLLQRYYERTNQFR
ncbi:MAG TPA: SWIM zinc finger family protein [Pyrinomonadaceae bacterium]|jgi:hypothetical protein